MNHFQLFSCQTKLVPWLSIFHSWLEMIRPDEKLWIIILKVDFATGVQWAFPLKIIFSRLKKKQSQAIEKCAHGVKRTVNFGGKVSYFRWTSPLTAFVKSIASLSLLFIGNTGKVKLQTINWIHELLIYRCCVNASKS